MTTRQTPDAVREASWTGDPHKLAAELRRVASVFDPEKGFRLPQLLRDAADEIDCLTTLDSRAGDAGEERDALLAALGWKTGPFSDPATRRVILEDTAGLRPEMVKARRRAQEAEGSSMMWYSIIGEFVHDSRSGVLGRMWNEVKRLRAQVRKLQAATPAPAVDAVPAGEAEPSLNRHDLYRFMDTLKLSEKRDVAKAIGFDPAPLPGENDMNRWRRMWLWAGENGKRSELATAIRAALSHGEGRK